MEAQLLWAPALCMLVSAFAFIRSRDLRTSHRLLMTLPGIGFTTLYLAAFGVALAGFSRPALGPTLWVSFAIVATCSVVALVRIRAGALHLLQALNFVGAGWMLFVGTMAITGEWL